MKIQVTKQDIERGNQCDSRNCPVALALKRKTHRSVSVSYEYIEAFRSEGNSTIYGTPTEVTKFIDDFDLGLKVKPFTFEL